MKALDRPADPSPPRWVSLAARLCVHSASQASEGEAPWLLPTLPFFPEQRGSPAGSSVPEAFQPQVSILCIPGPSEAPFLPFYPQGFRASQTQGLYPHYIVYNVYIMSSPYLRICHGSSISGCIQCSLPDTPASSQMATRSVQ